jgi:hypothetical protein
VTTVLKFHVNKLFGGVREESSAENSADHDEYFLRFYKIIRSKK